LVLISCTSQPQVSTAELEDGKWVLTSLNGFAPLDGTQISLEFSIGQVSGNAGCNHYGGSYQIQNDALSIKELYNTEMACQDVRGVMDQERTYLDLLSIANHLVLQGENLTLFNDSQTILVFTRQEIDTLVFVETVAQTAPLPTETPDEFPSPTFEPPEGFVEYQDVTANVSIYIPDGWVVMGIVPGQYAVFQSYPLDKYIGGESLQTGDAKCDLNIQLVETSLGELIQQWKDDSMTTIVSEEEFNYLSGNSGKRFVIDSMGRAVVFTSEIDGRAVLLTCFGDFSQVDSIAETLNGLE